MHTYRHDDESLVRYAKYIARCAIKNRRQFILDRNYQRSIRAAMDSGIKMFDTSSAYCDGEYELGRALKKYDRESYFVVSKVSNSDQYTERILEAFERSLKNLGMEYLDLYLLHWPVKDYWINSWKELEKLYKQGKCKAIGVCNCNIHHLEELKMVAEIQPMVNQIECHPLFTQDELRAYCEANDIQVMAYTATARMDERLRKTVLVPLADKYGKSLSQIMLRWHQQIGNVPIFNSAKIAHIMSNADIYDFSLSEEELDMISAININSRLRYDPDNCDFSQL